MLERIAAAVLRLLLVLPTGTGKTVVFAALVRYFVSRGKRALVVAHRTELLEQAQKKLADVGVTASLEKAELRAGNAPVVVASVQSLQKRRLEALDPTEFGIVVVDEGHHGMAPSYRKITDHFAGVPILYVTATPDRADGKALAEICDEVAFTYELRDAIRDGWLVPLVVRRVELVGVSLAKVRTVAGELDQKQLAEVMAADEAILGVVKPLLEQIGDRPGLLFAVTVAHAYQLAEALCDIRVGVARVAHGEMDADERAEVLEAFRRGDCQILVNVALYTEGFDEPRVRFVASAAPTKSRIVYCQRIGRGTRPLLGPGVFATGEEVMAESRRNGKADVLVIDFVGDTGRHSLIGPVDALAAGPVTDEQRKEAERLATEGDRDAMTLLDDAQAALVEKRREARKSANADYFAREVDPFFGAELGDFDKYLAIPLAGEPAHPRLVEQIVELTRIAPPATITNAEAQRLLDALALRKKLGLVTSRNMIRWLHKYGLDVATMPHHRARAIMGALEQRSGWAAHGAAYTAIRDHLHRYDLADRCFAAFAALSRAIARRAA